MPLRIVVRPYLHSPSALPRRHGVREASEDTHPAVTVARITLSYTCTAQSPLARPHVSPRSVL